MTREKKPMAVHEARRRAFTEAAALIEAMDLQQLYGDHHDVDVDALSDAQNHVVASLRSEAGRA